MSCFSGMDKKFCLSKPRNNEHSSNINKPTVVKSSSRQQIYRSGDFIIECDSTQNNFTGEAIVKRADNNRLVFIGKLIDGLRNGYGKQYNEEGEEVFEGEYANNKKNGWGKIVHSIHYSGQFRDNEYSGYGRLLTDEYFYQGTFLQNQFHGTGVFIKSKPGGLKNRPQLWQQFEIDTYVLGRIQKCPQKLFGEDQDEHNIEEIYMGQWADGKKNGCGKLWRDQAKTWYAGQFSFDVFHGNGTLSDSKTTQIQKGFFSKGKFLK